MPEAYSNRPFTFLRESDPVAAYFRSIRRPVLSRADEDALAWRIAGGDKRAILELMEAGLFFVADLCLEFAHRGLSISELINEGNLGLLRAAAAFPSSGGTRFLPFSEWWIRQALTSAVEERAKATRLGVRESARLRRIGIAFRKLARKSGRRPSLAALELETGLPAEAIQAALNCLSALRAIGAGHSPRSLAGRIAVGKEWAAELGTAFLSCLKRILASLATRPGQVGFTSPWGGF